MNLIQQVTNDPLQKQTLILPDGTQLTMVMQYKPMQFGWFILSLEYGTFVLKGIRISVSPNFLNQFRNQIPFGMACYSKDNREPTQLEDFLSGAAKLYLLTQEDCEAFAGYLSGQARP